MSDSEKSKKSHWEHIKRIIYIFAMPFIYIERLCEWFSVQLKPLAIFKVLEYAGRLTVLVAVIFYIKGCPERRMQSENLQMQVENLRQQLANQEKAKHYQAWQVINLAQGKTGSGGRMEALQDLHKDGINLCGVDVSQAYLPQLDLENAWLSRANFSKANLFGATLSHAVLQNANLSDADVSEANLSGVFLTRANLSNTNFSFSKLFEASLFDADVSGANLWGANLWRAKLIKANLSHANLYEANLSGADLSEANLSGANFYGANLWKSNLRSVKNWRDIKSIEQTNIFWVENPPDGFTEWAKEHGAIIIDTEWKKSVREIKKEQTKEK